MRKIVKTEISPIQLDLFLSDVFLVVSTQTHQIKENISQKNFEKDFSSNKRFIDCSGIKLEYELRRSKRRSIGFLINENGLRVTAPQKVSLKSIEEAIREKEHWIRNKLHYFSTQYTKPSSFVFENGAKLPYLGNNFSLQLKEDSINHISLNPLTHELIIKTTHPQSQTLIKNLITKWLQEKAKEHFSQRLPYFAQELNVKYRQFALSTAKYRWGSCSTSGNIRLNWRLIHFPQILIDYVIIHELAHLYEMNHSKSFWNIVSQTCPQYKILRKQLNQQGHTLPSW